jgi:hypothetical protein
MGNTPLRQCQGARSIAASETAALFDIKRLGLESFDYQPGALARYSIFTEADEPDKLLVQTKLFQTGSDRFELKESRGIGAILGMAIGGLIRL